MHPLSKQPPRMSMNDDFAALCREHGVSPTKRQESKYLNRYGALAAARGTSTRRKPPGR